jgi:hypothetical protein
MTHSVPELGFSRGSHLARGGMIRYSVIIAGLIDPIPDG